MASLLDMGGFSKLLEGKNLKNLSTILVIITLSADNSNTDHHVL